MSDSYHNAPVTEQFSSGTRPTEMILSQPSSRPLPEDWPSKFTQYLEESRVGNSNAMTVAAAARNFFCSDMPTLSSGASGSLEMILSQRSSSLLPSYAQSLGVESVSGNCNSMTAAAHEPFNVPQSLGVELAGGNNSIMLLSAIKEAAGDSSTNDFDELDHCIVQSGPTPSRRMARRSKRSKLSRSHVAHFFDVEAEASGSDETSSESDSEGADFFIDNHKIAEEIPHQQPLHRWDDLDGDVDHLEAIVQDLRNRDRASRRPAVPWPRQFPDDNDMDLPVRDCHLYPTPQDPELYRVRVHSGQEWDVVVAILQLCSVGPSGILTAFARDAIQGAVYIEASSSNDIRFTLHGVSGIVRSRYQDPIIDVVPLDDRVPLLEMSMASMGLTSLSWVRLKCRGQYRNDLALVLNIDPRESMATVYVVPRIRMDCNSKRKRSSERVPANLFDAEQVKSIYGPNSVEKRNRLYFFKKDIYKNGLLEKEVRLTDMSTINVLPTQPEVDIYRRTGDEDVIKALDSGFIPLQIGDRIQATAGSFRGLTGHVVDICDDHTLVVDLDTKTDATLSQSCEKEATSKMVVNRIQLCFPEVRKKFELGDYVHVLQGVHSGNEGYIVQMDNKDATIYKRCFAVSKKHGTREEPGVEIKVSIFHINWMSASSKVEGTVSQSGPADGGSLVGSELGVTHDPYRQMEVRIQKGQLKGYFGTVIGTRWQADGSMRVDLKVFTLPSVYYVSLDVGDVVGRFSGLPLEKARWLPRNLPPSAPPEKRQPTPPGSPLQSKPDEPLSAAWDPSSLLPGEIESAYIGPERTRKPGEWLLDPRLVGKKLDVRIMGTSQTSFYKGRYENNCGFVTLKKALANVHDSVIVRIGFAESQRSFPVGYLHPQTTTERPPFVADKDIVPITSKIGQRVVIIGPDAQGSQELMSHYGHVVYSGYILPAGLALVQVCETGDCYGKFGYFDELSICRSHQETDIIPRG